MMEPTCIYRLAVGAEGCDPSAGRCDEGEVVEVRRFELLTSCLQSRRSSQLSYTPPKGRILPGVSGGKPTRMVGL
jgi:hypothetical protein